MEKSITTERHRQLAELLRRLREEAELTQMELAERLAVSQSVISKVESGQRRLDLVQLETYAQALGIPLPNLIRRWQRAR